MRVWTPDSDAWASGFIDGEGSFVITRSGNRRDTIGPRFVLGLRADEAPILRHLADAFGGSVAFSPASGGSRPRGGWTIVAKADLRRLCAYLDRFPLRAKKARDYAVWREAVRVYLAARDIYEVQGEMVAFRQALGEAREYIDPLEAVERGPSCVEIARVVGVDPSTVSRALAGSPLVAEATRQRIEQARAELMAGGEPRHRLRLVV